MMFSFEFLESDLISMHTQKQINDRTWRIPKNMLSRQSSLFKRKSPAGYLASSSMYSATPAYMVGLLGNNYETREEAREHLLESAEVF